MDAFQQADAAVQMCGGLLGIVFVAIFVLGVFFRKRKK